MKTTTTLLLTLLICSLTADPVLGEDVKRDYPLPETILILDVTADGPTYFGNRFCWVGDQNGDGFDDLLVSHDPYQPRPPHSNKNQVELYYGGAPMNTQPGFTFTIDNGDSNAIGSSLSYIGNLTSRFTQMIGIGGYHYNDKTQGYADHRDIIRYSLFNGGSQLDTISEIVVNRKSPYNIFLSRQAHKLRPFDLNRDGYDDFVAAEDLGSEGPYGKSGTVNIYYGGSYFDTIPDWRVWIGTYNFHESTCFGSGGDVNADGYDDLLVRYEKYNGQFFYTTVSLFLGGSPPDTVPVCTWDQQTYTKPYRTQLKGFSFIPDINGDGYDDWAITYSVDGTNDGTFVYFGSEQPDSIYDINLPKHGGIIMGSNPDVTGGDFNGDGYGDIVTSNYGAFYHDGEVRIYFGRPGWDIKQNADVSVNGIATYGESFLYFGQYVGAVGDYNGDGIDDFVVRVGSNDGPDAPKLIVLAGNQGWKVDVENEQMPVKQELALTSYPNPVNSEATINFTVGITGNVSIELIDIQGRVRENLYSGTVPAGSHQLTWRASALPTGIYFIRLKTDHHASVITKVVLMK